MKGHARFQMEIKAKRRKYIWQSLKFFSPVSLVKFNQTRHKASLGEGKSSLEFEQMEGHIPFQKEIMETFS